MTEDIIKKYVEEIMERPIPDNRGNRFYVKRPENLAQKEVDGKYHIIFVAYYADSHILKKAIQAKIAGRFFLTLIAGCIREDVVIENYFDQAYEYEDFKDFFHMAKEASPWAWHAVTPYYHAAIIIWAGHKDSRLVFDMVDPALFVCGENNRFEVLLERELIQHASAVVHKLPESSWEILRNEYGVDTRGYQIYALPCSRFIRKPSRNGNRTKQPRVAYAGGIIPYDIAVSRGYGNHVFDDLIEIASDATFDLTIFVNQNAREMPWHQHRHYYDLEKANRNFHFRKGLPYSEIIGALSEFTAGIFFDNLRLASFATDHFRHNMASKLFTYIEAGIPVIVYEEAEMMADIVVANGLGAVYSAKEPGSIVKAVQKVGETDYSDAIRKFCRENMMDEYRDKFTAMYGINV